MFETDTAGLATDIPDTLSTQALSAAVDGLLALDASALSDDELASAMVGVRREQARLAAAVAELTARFDTRRVYAEDGSRSAADWIATRARLPRPQVAGQVRVARRLAAAPMVRAAWRAGHLSEAHARRLTDLAANARTAAHFPDGEPLLVGQATTLRFDDFERAVAHWRDAADPDGPEQRHGRDNDLRRVNLSPGFDGVGHLDGYLTAFANASIAGALDRIERELFAADWAAARAEHGDDVTAASLARTSAQRRHDALEEMALRAMAAPADGKRPAPLITVMVGYETFAGRVCELAGGTVVAPGAVAELLGADDTLIERAVFDAPNRITDISGQRRFRGILRRILEIKHPRCTHETCHVPAHLCEGDHIVAWSHGGLTTQANGQPQCPPHNRWRHTHPHKDPTHPGHPGRTHPDETHRGPSPSRRDHPGPSRLVGQGCGPPRGDGLGDIDLIDHDAVRWCVALDGGDGRYALGSLGRRHHRPAAPGADADAEADADRGGRRGADAPAPSSGDGRPVLPLDGRRWRPVAVPPI